jgi:hypothetical protein
MMWAFTICATRQQRGLLDSHIPQSEVGCVLGHSQANTTYRYVNANVETAKRAAAALDAFNAETMEAETAPELVH